VTFQSLYWHLDSFSGEGSWWCIVEDFVIPLLFYQKFYLKWCQIL